MIVAPGRRVGKGATRRCYASRGATCPPLFRWQPHDGGHASLCPPYGTETYIYVLGHLLPEACLRSPSENQGGAGDPPRGGRRECRVLQPHPWPPCVL